MKLISHIRKLRRWLSDSHLARDGRERSAVAKAGFTLIELMFVIEVMGFLVLIGITEMRNTKEHAKVVGCRSYQVQLQRALWSEFALTGDFPINIAPILVKMPNSKYVPKTFDYTGGPGSGLEGYYMRCAHDHAFAAVLFVDSGSYLPPKPIYNLASARGAIP